MDNYKEKYLELIETINKNKETESNLRTSLELKQKEYYRLKNKNADEVTERAELIQEKQELVTRNDKKINKMYKTLAALITIIIFLSTFSVGKLIISKILEGLFKKLIVGYLSLIAGVVIELLALYGLKEFITKIQKSKYRQHEKEPDCIKLNTKIQKKSNVIEENNKKQEELLNQINGLKEKIETTHAKVISNEAILRDLEQELVKMVVGTPKQIEENAKPYTRLKIKENQNN